MRSPFIFVVRIALLAAFFATPSLAAARTTATYSAKLNASALQAGQTAVIAVVVDVAPGFHAQSHQPLNAYLIPFEVKASKNPAIEFLDPIYPAGTIENFPILGNQSVYTGEIVIYLPLRIKPDAKPGDFTLAGSLTWQACNDQVCFRPERDQPFSIATTIVAATSSIALQNQEFFKGFDPRVFSNGAAPVALTSISTGTRVDFFGHSFELATGNVPLALGIALIVGILFNLMPCVLPVLPLKAIGFFEVSRQNRARCLMLGGVFSLGVVTVFIALAILIVALRSSLHFSWGEQFKYGWFIWGIVIILVAMALGMFGLFEVVLPNKVYELSPNHESVWGNFVFGMLTAVLSTPCTAPMFAGLLAWATAQPIALGVAAVVTVGVGMALPYLILSAFPSLASCVPRTGPWSAVLKQMMGFLVLAVAVYFAGGRLASNKEFFWAVFGVVAAAMVFLIIRTVQLSHRIWPIVAAVIASIIVIGISLALTQRLLGGLEWKPYTDEALAAARATGQPVLVEFTANWCGNCLALEASVYHDPQTAAAIKNDGVILLRADLTSSSAPGWKIVDQLNPGGGIPLTAIYGPHVDQPLKLTSLYTTQNLIDALNHASAK